MKYDILDNFRAYLHQECSPHTADVYYYMVVRLLKDQQFNSPSQIDDAKLHRQISVLRSKNEISAAKNGLLRLAACYPGFQAPPAEMFSGLSKVRSNQSVSPPKVLSLEGTMRRINAPQNKKLKLALRLMLASGGRESEIAALEKRDISITADVLTIHIRNGKGGYDGIVTCRHDPYLLSELPAYLKGKSPNDRLFYRPRTMREKLHAMGLEGHDLRRIAAQLYFREIQDNNLSDTDAREETRKFLRHAREDTTLIYLTRRKVADIPNTPNTKKGGEK